MKLAPSSTDAFNVIVVGAWNPAIFAPEWAKEYLADDKTREVVLAIPFPPGNLPPRLTVDNINLYPSTEALMVDCVEYNDAAIDRCTRKFQQLAELLPHTPVNAIGINFRFSGDLEDSDMLSSLFTFSDAGMIDSTRYRLSGAIIKRGFRLADSTILNLSLDNSSDNLRVEFNFHTDVQRMSEIAAKTSAEQIRAARNQSFQFLSDVYGIELDADA